MFVLQNFSTRNDTIFCGVFDGHGPFGHMVAKKVRDSLPLILCTQWKANSNSELSNLGTTENANGNSNIEETASPSIDDEWCEPLEVQENEKLPDMYLPLKRSFLKAFRLMDKELKLHPTIDCFCSGTTAVTMVKQVNIRETSSMVSCHIPLHMCVLCMCLSLCVLTCIHIYMYI